MRKMGYRKLQANNFLQNSFECRLKDQAFCEKSAKFYEKNLNKYLEKFIQSNSPFAATYL